MLEQFPGKAHIMNNFMWGAVNYIIYLNRFGFKEVDQKHTGKQYNLLKKPWDNICCILTLNLLADQVQQIKLQIF